MTLDYLSVCSGIEAASVAWGPLGWRPAAFAEIEPFPCHVLGHRFGAGRPLFMPDPDAPDLEDKVRRERRAAIRSVAGLPEVRPDGNGIVNLGDLTRFEEWPVVDADLLVGGTPCQAFSVAGRRLSLSDNRGNLSLAYVRLAHALAARSVQRGRKFFVAVWENVPGVLSTDDNAFGCFMGALVGADDALRSPVRDGSWPSAGMASGPGARACWRVLDAQHFGLAQRRERVFVVASFGDEFDPAAVLFEPQRLPGDYSQGEPARKADRSASARGSGAGGVWRQIAEAVGDGGAARNDGVAGTLGGASQSGGFRTTDLDNTGAFVVEGAPHAVSGPVTAEFAKGPQGPAGEGAHNLVAVPSGVPSVAHTLRGEGFDASEDGTGRGVPLVPALADPVTANEGSTYTHEGSGNFRLHNVVPAEPPIPFDTTQMTPPANRSRHAPGGPAPALAAASHPPAVAFTCKDYGGDAGALSPTLRSMGHDGSHANGGGQVAVAFTIRGRDGEPQAEASRDGLSPTLRGGGGGSSHAFVGNHTVVRRLTPRECERLQGFPDDWTLIPWSGSKRRPEDRAETARWLLAAGIGEAEAERLADTPDGPRYKAIGNSKAVDVVAWLGARIDAEARRVLGLPPRDGAAE